MNRKELVTLKDEYLGDGDLGGAVRNQPAEHTATVETMVNSDPELTSCTRRRPRGYSVTQHQKIQLMRDQGRRGGITTGPGNRPVCE